MKATNCNNPSCGKELVHTEGRRPKKYCSDKCRISHHVSQKHKPKYVQIEKFNELQEKYKEVLQKVAENNKPENKEKIEKERNGEPEKLSMQERIALAEQSYLNNKSK